MWFPWSGPVPAEPRERKRTNRARARRRFPLRGARGRLRQKPFGQAVPFRARGVGADDPLGVVEHADDHPTQGTPERADAIPDPELRGTPEGVDRQDHGVAVEHAGDVVGDRLPVPVFEKRGSGMKR